ncbi:MAG TPA: hypothetical protein VLJ86_08450 [Ramlibacter sp.]|nr:hypothetical protein [Ramlibacter sp.]
MFSMGTKPTKAETKTPERAKARKPTLVSVTVQLEPKQRDKLALLGGDAWLREQIDEANLASAFAPPKSQA